MNDYVHFEGDPAVDSQRRHLERVIKGHPPRQRWAWIAAAVAGGGLWAAWRAAARGAEIDQERAGARGRGGATEVTEKNSSTTEK